MVPSLLVGSGTLSTRGSQSRSPLEYTRTFGLSLGIEAISIHPIGILVSCSVIGFVPFIAQVYLENGQSAPEAMTDFSTLLHVETGEEDMKEAIVFIGCLVSAALLGIGLAKLELRRRKKRGDWS
jgi:hypothetical protein